jgi:archaellum component FlaF (FlaF/FlaG flagellin family)
MTNKYPSGTVCWARDPTLSGSNKERPVIILAHKDRPFNSSDCTVMCAGTSASKHSYPTPELEKKHLKNISFNKKTYLMPYALYTIAPGALNTTKSVGKLTPAGEKLVKKYLINLLY